MPVKITDRLVRELASPTRGNKITYDTEVKGFGVRITAGDARSFILNYRANGIERRMTIGSYPDWSVTAAREQAKVLKREVDLGRDPMGQRHEDRTAPTVQDLWERYQIEHLPRKSPRSQADDRSMFRSYILPVLGRTKVKDVRPADIDALHRTISEHHKVRANRVGEVLRKAFSLAVRWEWCLDNPCHGFHRNPEERRQRYLTPAELVRLATALDQHTQPTAANAIRLMMLTGARRGEVLSATWAMFDLDKGVWTKPSAHTKQRKEHRVPLSKSALDLLCQLKIATTGDYVFPGRDGKPLTDVKRSWAALCKAAGLKDARLHDLRHTYASILASSGLSLPIIGALLGHTQTQTTARYSHLMDEVLRQATEQVAAAIPLTWPDLGKGHIPES